MPTRCLPCIVFTTGEPTGIGMALAVHLATTPLAADLVVITDRDALQHTASGMGITLHTVPYDQTRHHLRSPGRLRVLHVPLRASTTDTTPDPRNSFHVLHALALAADGCASGQFDAMITTPMDTDTIYKAGEDITSSTAFLARHERSSIANMHWYQHGQPSLIKSLHTPEGHQLSICAANANHALTLVQNTLTESTGYSRLAFTGDESGYQSLTEKVINGSLLPYVKYPQGDHWDAAIVLNTPDSTPSDSPMTASLGLPFAHVAIHPQTHSKAIATTAAQLAITLAGTAISS